MSPPAAWASPIFRGYFMAAVILLAAGGLAIGGMKLLTKRDVGHAWASYCGWLVMIPVVLLTIFAGRIPSMVLFGLLGLGGFIEYARATGLIQERFMMFVVIGSMATVSVAACMTDPRIHTPGWYGVFMALPVYAICLILLVPIVRDRTDGYLAKMALAIVGFIYMGWMFGHLTFLCNSKHAYGYILYLLFAVEINDVAAFTSGKLLGGHKLRPNISPQKTWEGAIGALLVSLTLPWMVRYSFPHFGAVDLVAIGLIVGIGGQLGDLTISVIKRDLEIKDMGQLIRGHGGILDRIDSMIYVAP
ncbi:MAG: phosphatidate cytidylyltransferase, partial [Planctomycetales bacterium]|nr:phosphatidate cytidylyltransferase [Planctomycetales bacterium]